MNRLTEALFVALFFGALSAGWLYFILGAVAEATKMQAYLWLPIIVLSTIIAARIFYVQYFKMSATGKPVIF